MIRNKSLPLLCLLSCSPEKSVAEQGVGSILVQSRTDMLSDLQVESIFNSAQADRHATGFFLPS